MNLPAETQPPETLRELVEGAAAAKRDGDPEKASLLLQAARRRTPSTPEEGILLGRVHLELGDIAEALGWFTRTSAQKPDWAIAHSHRALALQLLNQPLEALEAVRDALALNPGDLVALKVVARLHLKVQRFDNAQRACEQIQLIHPNDPDAAAMLAECRQGSALPLPGAFSGDFSSPTRAWPQLGAEHLLQQSVVGTEAPRIVIRHKPRPQKRSGDGFAVPPPELTMGYGGSDLNHYLELGHNSHRVLKNLLLRHDVRLESGDAMLDWGCAAGRVMRCFKEEAERGCAVWGGDVHTPAIEWAKGHLSPPFRFFNCSSFPHLPFPDGTFKLIYAFSVITHIVALRDLWLLELRRVLRPGGCAILTIHDEHTWTWFRKHGMPAWMPAELRLEPQLPGECVDIQGSAWDQTFTFFHSDYIRRTWGQYFRVAEILPLADCTQAAVILRKN